MHHHAAAGPTYDAAIEAASRLRHKDYYRYAFAHRPAWQGI